MKEYKFKINQTEYTVDIESATEDKLKLKVNGREYEVTVDNEGKAKVNKPAVRPTAQATAPATPKPSKPAAAAKGSKVTTPLPGTIMDVLVNVGDSVKEGQTVAILEAMKMENNIEADASGVVKEVKVRKGDSVMEGEVLVVIE